MSHTLHTCIDRSLFPLEQDTRLSAIRRALWPENLRTLHVRFIGGYPAVYPRIVQVVSEWEKYAGVKFIFDNHPNAQIRVGFDPGGSWSFVGRDVLDKNLVSPTEPTVNFGWLEPGVDDEVLCQVVLHEFGHVLGLVHEHQSPNAGIPWNKEAVYRYYAGPPNYWGKADVDVNLLHHYDQAEMNSSVYDRESIMLYPIPNELTIGDYEVGWNTSLSEIDKEHIAKLYPKETMR